MYKRPILLVTAYYIYLGFTVISRFLKNKIFFSFYNQKLKTMNVNIQTVHFNADTKLLLYVQEKVQKLLQYHDKITKIDVYLKLDNLVHNIKDKVAEIKILAPRQEFFVKQTSKSFEESFDAALESIITQIKRKKEKIAA